MSQEIIIIAAMSENRVIGKDGVMPWSIKEDMRHFTELTKGRPCIMGRKTWDSLFKKPLHGRLNVVVSKTMSHEQEMINEQGVIICTSLQNAIEHCAAYEEIFIIGGESIYKQAMEVAAKIELTLIHSNYEGDTFFPEIDPACWKIENQIDNDKFSFITYTKKD